MIPLRKTEGTVCGCDVYQRLQEVDIRQELLNSSDRPDTTRPKEDISEEIVRNFLGNE